MNWAQAASLRQRGEIIATDITIGEAVDKQLEWDKNKSNCSNK